MTLSKDDVLHLLQGFNNSTATELHYEQYGTILRFSKPTTEPPCTRKVIAPVNTPEPSATATPVEITPPVATTPVAPPAPTELVAQGTPVKAQLVGVFYPSQSPDSPPFVSVGQTVAQGDTLCIIEAMKVMNEIKAPVAGTVVVIHPSSGDLVEFGQTLIEIR